jgi:hypothetical protein
MGKEKQQEVDTVVNGFDASGPARVCRAGDVAVLRNEVEIGQPGRGEKGSGESEVKGTRVVWTREQRERSALKNVYRGKLGCVRIGIESPRV